MAFAGCSTKSVSEQEETGYTGYNHPFDYYVPAEKTPIINAEITGGEGREGIHGWDFSATYVNTNFDERKLETRVSYLKYLISLKPSKQKKYEAEIQKIMQQLDGNKLNFLREFYADLYKVSLKDFTKQYRRRCSTDIEDQLQEVYENLHGSKGYAWFLFGDNNRHDGTEFSYTPLEDNWYQVKADSSEISVRLNGLGKNVQITGLINTKFGVSFTQ